MSVADSCTTWFAGLPDDRRIDVRTVVGAIPDWMTESLGHAGIAVIDAEMPDGVTGHLSPTALAMFLAEMSTDPAVDGEERERRSSRTFASPSISRLVGFDGR